MIEHQGPGCGSFIAGSVQNQRIERLWRDVFMDVARRIHGCTHLFYDIFLCIEDEYLLNIENELWYTCFAFITSSSQEITRLSPFY